MTGNIESKVLFNSFTDSLNKIVSNKIIGGRSVWSRLLNISSPGISQWVQGKTIPSSHKLKSMINYLSDFDLEKAGLKDVYNEFIGIFDKILDHKISSKFNNHRTIGHYVLQDDFNELQVQTRSMSFLVLRQFILTMKRLMHEVYDMMEEEKSSEYIITRLNNISLASKQKAEKYSENDNIVKVKFEKDEFFGRACSRFDSAYSEGAYQFKTYVTPNLETPFNSFSTLATVCNRLIDSRKIGKMNKMGWVLFPTDYHLSYDSSIEPEVNMYKNLMNCFDQPNTDFKTKFAILEALKKGLENNEINDLYPGLIFSLSQSLFYNEILENLSTLSDVHKIRKKFLDIYIIGYNKEIFKPINITDKFFKRTVELSCAYNELEFLENYSKNVEFNVNTPQNREFLFDYKDINISLYYGFGKEKPIQKFHFESKTKLLDIDFMFLQLRHSFLFESEKILSVFNTIYQLLTSQKMKDHEALPINFDRLNYYQILMQVISSNSDIKRFIHSCQQSTIIDDISWAEHNLDNLQRQSANL